MRQKPWKYAIVQHPMWLIIAEDTLCAERTPPWGCPNIEEHAKRLSLCLDSIERFPQMHMNFDFSAVELEDVAEKYPDIMQRIKKLTAQGRISFVNGTYSQPHLQILSVESAIRQFQYGLRVINDLTGYQITCYSAQEPGLTPQAPQILRSFGYLTATTPDFPYGVRLIEGHVQHWNKRWEWLAGDDLLYWGGIDGTTIPIWLKSCGIPTDSVLDDDRQHGLLGHTRLRVDMPDMMEVSPEWVETVEKTSVFAQLDRTLAEMVSSTPPEAIAEIDANYAYTEGADAEELSRANTRTETALLSLEAMSAFLPVSGFDFDTAWKIFLKAQHHDAYWIGGPELRAKSIAWLDGVIKSADERMRQIADTIAHRLPKSPEGSRSVLVFHPYARPHKTPVEVDCTDISLVDEKSKMIPAQPSGTSKVTFIAQADGLGYETCFAQSSVVRRPSSVLKQTYRYVNDFYSLAVGTDGVVTSLVPKGARNLLKKTSGRGGNLWLYENENGDVLPGAIPQGTRITKGPVFDLIEAPVQVGVVKMTTRLSLYHELSWFAVETELDFDEPTEIGDYFDDRTKLHYAWPVGTGAQIRHALGGCPTAARPLKTFLVNPWLDVSHTQGGLSFCLFNAAKCWLDEEGCLRTLVAWGHNGAHFHNRQGPLSKIMGPLSWIKPMDLRLHGKYMIKYAVWPHAGTLDNFEIADWAASLLMPPVARVVETGGGSEPLSKTYLSVKTPGVVPLSVRSENEEVVLRMMEMDGKNHRLKMESGKKVSSLCNLDGTSVKGIGPHRIVEARLGS